ncbi:hypothetical protein CsSME_00009013 [Camellia sinensis var. sinensis]
MLLFPLCSNTIDQVLMNSFLMPTTTSCTSFDSFILIFIFLKLRPCEFLLLFSFMLFEVFMLLANNLNNCFHFFCCCCDFFKLLNLVGLKIRGGTYQPYEENAGPD